MSAKSLISRRVVSNQSGIHEKLEETLTRHRENPFVKPVSAHTRVAFESFLQAISRHPGKPVVLDSCCGVGESTLHFAESNPGHLVIGVDKSVVRLEKGRRLFSDPPANMLLLRADVFDLWRLIAGEGIAVDKHYVLYPNPWPKKQHLKRRIHGHPSFFDFIRIGRTMEIRSNWKIYLEELQFAAQFATECQCRLVQFQPDPCMTPFERKYSNSGQELFRLIIEKA